MTLSIRVNDKPLSLMRRVYLAYVFAGLAVRQLVGSRYQLNIDGCAPLVSESTEIQK